jgi:hypothetical protein
MLNQYKHLLDSPLLGPAIVLAMIATGLISFLIPI